jgi:CMP-N-acetylneuraminic acid synthetase
MSTHRIAALVPMRHHSERVPGKTLRPLGGVPLYQHILRTLLECPLITAVVIDTDSPDVTDGVVSAFPSIRVIPRPAHLRDGMIPTNDILVHDVSLVDADYYVQTHVTNPLLRAETITRAMQSLLSNAPGYDSLFSVTRIQTRLWDMAMRPVNHDPAKLLRTQDLPPLFEENSCLYMFTRDTLERRGNRIGERPLMFEIDRDEAWDIDEEFDFAVADFLYRRRQETAGAALAQVD